MAFPKTFTSDRLTVPDRPALVGLLQALDATAVLLWAPAPPWVIEKATAWTTPQTNAAQNAIDTAPAITPQRDAQNAIDRWPIEYLALADALLDEINILRQAMSPPLAVRTRAQGIAAIRTKAGQWT
jgi:hypothetical protein